LRRLSVDGYHANTAALSLLQSAWLPSIHWLGLPCRVLQSAAGMLRSAARLEYLCVFVPSTTPPDVSTVPEDHPVWTFAATHPSLRSLGFQVFGRHSVFPQLPADSCSIAALRLRRPDLHLRCDLRSFGGHSFEAEMLEAETIPAPQP